MNKREFLQTLSLAGLSLTVSGSKLDALLERYEKSSARELASDEEFWENIRSDYKLKSEYINLENGYYSIMPQSTLDAYITKIKNMNLQGSWFMRKEQVQEQENSRKRMAEFMGCNMDELIITRNTTESMAVVINGFNWKKDDEVIFAEQDYGSMQDMFRQVSKRSGSVNTVISIPNNPASDEELLQLYEKAITPKTRLILLSHMINITGQILPVKKICDMAHQKKVKVLVDGAHTVAHIDFKITELNCDYFAASLHKWLGAPLGNGLLYVKKQNIEELWPLFAEYAYQATDIRKLDHSGTYPVHSELAIADAIQFHNKIGGKRKEERLRYLQEYWTSKVRGMNKIILNTPAESRRACAIANAGIRGMEPSRQAQVLLEKYKIWTVAIDTKTVKGVRITPGLFTKTSELDVLVKALGEMSA